MGRKRALEATPAADLSPLAALPSRPVSASRKSLATLDSARRTAADRQAEEIT